MLVIPALDLRGGRCVRLRQGDYTQETVFHDDPVVVAKSFVEQGAKYLHLVDLDGAKAGRPVHLETIRDIVRASGVPCEVGGGLREKADLEAAFTAGVDRVIIGTQALKRPDWFVKMVRQYPHKVALGLDAKNGRVATDGWLEVSSLAAIEIAQRWQDLPIAAVIYTDISRDGMMSGPNESALAEMAAATRLPVIASGGVTTLDDIRRLRQLPLAGCIIGRALYEGTLNLKEAIGLVSEE